MILHVISYHVVISFVRVVLRLLNSEHTVAISTLISMVTRDKSFRAVEAAYITGTSRPEI